MTSALAAQLPRPGDVVGGKFVLDRLLGQGGMGAVFAAKHRKLGHAVAIKVMLADPANPEAAARFINEGKAAAHIESEHVVRVSDVDEENGYAFMVLELLEGEDLAQLLERERRVRPSTAVHYVVQALSGLVHAHAQHIVHRDLKPSNLFLTRRKDGSMVVKILDFGISKANSQGALGQAPSSLTSTKAMLGSPLYMSPEQLRSSKSVDERADIWAIGVILYELLTGQLPFNGDNLGELFAAILESDATPVRNLAPEVCPELEAIVLRCLRRAREERFQSAAEVLRVLTPLSVETSSPFAFTAAPSTGRMPASFVQTPNPQSPAYPQTPPVMAMTPQNSPGFDGRGTGPGPGPGPGRPGGTIALAAQTNNTWGTTNSGAVPKRSAAPFLIGGVAALVLAGAGVLGWSRLHASSAATSAASTAATVATAPPPPASAAPPATVAGATPPVVPAADPAPRPALQTDPTPPVHVDPKPKTQAKTDPKPDPKPSTPGSVMTAATPAKPPPPPKPTGGVENVR